MQVARDASTGAAYVACVKELAGVLERLDAADVQLYLQYVLLPLCVILDAKVDVERQDAAMCGTLDCLRVLASKAQLNEAQGVPLVQRLVLMLGDAEAPHSAEARRLMADVLGATFDGAAVASRDGASAGLGPGLDARVLGTRVPDVLSTATYLSDGQLRPLVGNALSVLLNHPYNDVTQPSSVVAANQVASLTALTKLVVAAGRQQMAFFVPGIATGLVKRLVMQLDSNLEGDVVTTKRTSSGLVAALRGLEVLIAVTLRDGDDDDDVHAALGDPAVDYVSQLRELSSVVPRAQNGNDENDEDEENLEALEASIQTDKNALRVEVNEVWARATAIRVADLLALCVPKLSIHRNSAVRLQVVLLASRVLGACETAFEGHDDVLLDALLLLAQDDWPSVRSAATGFLKDGLSVRHRERLEYQLLSAANVTGSTAGTGDGREGLQVEKCLQGAPPATRRSLFDLPRVLKERSEVVARHEASRICSLIECCRGPGMSSVVGSSGMCDEAVLDALVACFQVDESSAVLVAAAPLIAAVPDVTDGIGVVNGGNAGAGETGARTRAGMPLMPAALRYMTSKATYDVFARLVRLLAIGALNDSLRDPSNYAFPGFVASCARRLRQLLLESSHSRRGNSSSAPSTEGDRLTSAAVVTVLSEFFAGAVEFVESVERVESVETAADGGDGSVGDSQGVSNICKMAALDVLYAFQDDGVWLSRTIPGTSGAGLAAILLQRCMVFVGVAARCLKGAFVDDGACTVTCLLPVVERYAGDSQYVSAAAKDAVNSICRFCGYPSGLRDLITGNMDYIVDGMCIRLRQPSVYPDAPKLFAALLRETGVAVSLIPLLAEPAQQMIRGVSILQRREKPENVLAFVMCTQEIARGLMQVSLEGLQELEALVVDTATGETDGDDREDDDDDDDLDDDRTVNTDSRPSIEEISGYFRNRSQRRHARDASSRSSSTIVVTRAVWDSTLQTRNRLEAAASLAQIIADSLGPLIVSKSLSVAVQSFAAATRALKALSDAHRGLELFKKQIQEQMVCAGQTLPPSGGKQAPPTFLPSVHLFWTPVMGSLKDWRVPVVEASIDALEALLVLAPEFLSKRFRNEAWPVLRAMMKEGTPICGAGLLGGALRGQGFGGSRSGPGGLSGRACDVSPALVSRIRRAVVGLFSNVIDALELPVAKAVLQPIARPLLRDILCHACESSDEAVVDAMRAGFERVAIVHPDSAWATLYTYGAEYVGQGHGQGPTPSALVAAGSDPAIGLAPFQDFRQWGDDWFWVTNQLQSLMI